MKTPAKYFAILRTQLINAFAYPADLFSRSFMIVIFMWVFFQLWRVTGALSEIRYAGPCCCQSRRPLPPLPSTLTAIRPCIDQAGMASSCACRCACSARAWARSTAGAGGRRGARSICSAATGPPFGAPTGAGERNRGGRWSNRRGWRIR